ncbi:MAG TPA: phosphopyruvate hydratase [Clostridia bacterium]|nr:phosphopyruvate hydratase [Clostridia bacterium]
MKPFNEKINSVHGMEILDSRGNPTVKVRVTLEEGAYAEAGVPSGASTGSFEAHELRDGGTRYGGKGVLKAVSMVEQEIAPAICGLYAGNITEIDGVMMRLDKTENKSRLGANAMLGVSLACARAAAFQHHVELFEFLGGKFARILPVPMMNILNGGRHADNNMAIQEFMIMPVGASSFSEALQWGSEIHHALGSLLKSKGLGSGVGDEGGFAPNLSGDEQALEFIVAAIEKAGLNTDQVKLAIDAAASEWAVPGGGYVALKRNISYTTEALCDYWEKLCDSYPILSLEDCLGEEDWEGWQQITERLGSKLQLVGDDLFVTNPIRLGKGIQTGTANAILIKPNQIGTLSETLHTISLAQSCGYATVISHRSGETEDAFIADLAVAVNAGQIKTGAPCRSERVAKYNRLLEIEHLLGKNAVYGSQL